MMPNNNQNPTPRQAIQELHPYVPGQSIESLRRAYGLDGEIIKLASNENPFGTSPKALAVLTGPAAEEAYRYPDTHDFVSAVADKLSVKKEMVIVGNGSNDVLDVIARTYLEAGDEAIQSDYAFIAYGIATDLCGAKTVSVPAKDFGHDLDAMLAAVNEKTKIIWIANPNNPTGTFIDGDSLKSFVNSVPKNVVVVVDEAYSEYLSADDHYDSIAWLNDHPNLVVVRTMSKIYGLAGLRLGYGIANPEIAELVNRARQPFSANILALSAGIAALSDQQFVESSKQNNLQGLQKLTDGLDKLGLSYLPTFGNFVTVKFKDSALVHESLLKSGIIVRPLGIYNMADFLRITVGKPEENSKLLAALEGILNSNG